VSVSALKDKTAELMSAPGADLGAAAKQQIALVAQTHGATRAFLVGGAMVLSAAVIIVVGLDVKHEELGSDEPVAAHVG